MDNYAWQCDKNLSDCMNYVYSNRLFSDVTILVGSTADREEVHAHKLVLMARSPVFYACFKGPLAVKEQLVITDIETGIFEEFLRLVAVRTSPQMHENKKHVCLLYCNESFVWYALCMN